VTTAAARLLADLAEPKEASPSPTAPTRRTLFIKAVIYGEE
jgi:hypothetical protein